MNLYHRHQHRWPLSTMYAAAAIILFALYGDLLSFAMVIICYPIFWWGLQQRLKEKAS